MRSAVSLNPLSKLKNLTLKHILIGFQYSTDAYNYKFNYNIGRVGTEIAGECGSGIVVVNELKNTITKLHAANTVWNYYSPITHRSSSYNGSMEVIDRSSFYFNQLLNDFTTKMDVSLYHLTFFWVTEFSGVNSANVIEYHYSTPMYFHITNFVQDASDSFGSSYNIDFVSCYNTHGLSSQFSTVLQNTVNNREGNTVNTAPLTYSPSTGLKSIKAEDTLKLESRKSRLNKTKYMKTIKDFCDSFEYTLTNQTKSHKKQLQEFLGIIKNEYSQKIDRVKEYALPLKYKIKVDSYYENKEIDNRNLPFEQFEINEKITGLSTITFPLGISLQTAISEVMSSSKDIGRDHTKPPITTFKITTSTSRECDGEYHIYTKINKYISPYTSDDVNTGPGNNLVTEPLQFSHKDPEKPDTNLLSVTYGSSTNTETTTIENVADYDDIQAVYGDRELQTSMRNIDGVNYFRNTFSGLKLARGILRDNGLQNSEAATLISNFNPSQATSYILKTVGNPHLLSDINRNPQEVIDDIHASPIVYKFAEYEPIYIKLRIYLGGERGKESAPPDNSPTYYYENHLHVYKIVNLYTSGEFIQLLYTGRTNERL